MHTDISLTNTTETIKLKHIPAFRQAFVVAATLIIVGVVLAKIYHENFLLLPLLVAGGLLFSGVVGWCPMALVLDKMPWNSRHTKDI